MEMRIAVRQCLDQEGNPRRFCYFLTIQEEETSCFFCENYGVRIVEEGGDACDLPAITTSASRIDELMTLLVDNTVSPAGLADVVADWL